MNILTSYYSDSEEETGHPLGLGGLVTSCAGAAMSSEEHVATYTGNDPYHKERGADSRHIADISSSNGNIINSNNSTTISVAADDVIDGDSNSSCSKRVRHADHTSKTGDSQCLRFKYLEKYLPPSPVGEMPDAVAAERIQDLLEQQARSTLLGSSSSSSNSKNSSATSSNHISNGVGFSLTSSIRSKKAFGNPYILSAVKDHFHINETHSAYSPDLFHPHSYSDSDYIDKIVERYSDPAAMRAFLLEMEPL